MYWGTDPVCIGGSHGCDHVPFDPVYSGNLQKLLRQEKEVPGLCEYPACICFDRSQDCGQGLPDTAGIFVPRFSTIQILVLALAGSAVYSLKRGKPRKSTRKREFPAKNILETLGVWVAFVLAVDSRHVPFWRKCVVWFEKELLLPFFLLAGRCVSDYCGRNVCTGLHKFNEFYNHLVLLVNILPGSILCKTMAGIGFLRKSAGRHDEGASAWHFGFGASVAASGGVFQVMYLLGDWLSGKTYFLYY